MGQNPAALPQDAAAALAANGHKTLMPDSTTLSGKAASAAQLLGDAALSLTPMNDLSHILDGADTRDTFGSRAGATGGGATGGGGGDATPRRPFAGNRAGGAMGSGQMLRGGMAAAGRQHAHQLAAAAPVAAAAGQLTAAVNTRQLHPAVGAAGPSDVAAPANGRNPTATMFDSSSGALYPLLVWHLLLAGNISSSSGGGRGGSSGLGGSFIMPYAAPAKCVCKKYRQVHINCTNSSVPGKSLLRKRLCQTEASFCLHLRCCTGGALEQLQTSEPSATSATTPAASNSAAATPAAALATEAASEAAEAAANSFTVAAAPDEKFGDQYLALCLSVKVMLHYECSADRPSTPCPVLLS